MGAPTNLSDRAGGELQSAARMHGMPLMRLNSLTRWYLRCALLHALAAALTPVLSIWVGAATATPLGFVFLLVSQFLFLGGFGIKFLPSSLGGNPHVWSLRLALWSFWLLLAGSLVTAAGYLVSFAPGGLPVGPGWFLGSGSGLLALGGVTLLWNLWQTMRNRVS